MMIIIIFIIITIIIIIANILMLIRMPSVPSMGRAILWHAHCLRVPSLSLLLNIIIVILIFPITLIGDMQGYPQKWITSRDWDDRGRPSKSQEQYQDNDNNQTKGRVRKWHAPAWQ